MQQGLDGVSAEDAATEGFLEFKMRKLQERKRTQDSGDPRDPKSGSPGKKKKDNHASGDGDGNDSFDTSGEIQGKQKNLVDLNVQPCAFYILLLIVIYIYLF
jgi:hypothetical protein